MNLAEPAVALGELKVGEEEGGQVEGVGGGEGGEVLVGGDAAEGGAEDGGQGQGVASNTPPITMPAASDEREWTDEAESEGDGV